MAKKKQFPMVVFVHEETSGGETYLVANYTKGDAADSEPKLIATYKLVEVGELKTEPVYKQKRQTR